MIKGTPALHEAVSGARGRRVLVVPFFLADGYFTRRAIPAALAKAPDGPRAVLCPPVGTSPRLAAIVRQAARAACRSQGLAPEKTALLLVGHGTRREASSSQAARALGETLSGDGVFASVACAFLEEPPAVADALAALPGKALVAVGLFAAEGAHGAGDVRALFAGAPARRAAHYAGVVGNAPGMADAIVERAMHCLERLTP